MAKLLSIIVISLISIACQESNPYSNGTGVTRSRSIKPALDAEGNPIADGAVISEEGTTVPGNEDDPLVFDAAEEDNLTKEQLTVTQIICMNHPEFADYVTEMSVLCADGKPTATFITSLDSPFNGIGEPRPTFIINTFNRQEETSRFLVLTTVEISRTVDQLLANGRQSLLNVSFTEGNATLVQSEVLYTPANGERLIGSSEVRSDLEVALRAGSGLSDEDTAIMSGQLIRLNKDIAVIGTTGSLKANDPENRDNILSKMVTFWVPQPNSTKIVVVAHQIVDNRGFEDVAAEGAANVGRGLMKATLRAFP